MVDEHKKSKSQLRAERRALQEAQRAAKLNANSVNTPVKQAAAHDDTVLRRPDQVSVGDTVSRLPVASKLVTPVERAILPGQQTASLPNEPTISDTSLKVFPSGPIRKQESNRVHLFKHLKEPDKRVDILMDLGLGRQSPIHPAFIALGVNSDEGRIWGANELCLHFILACEALIRTHHSCAPAQNSLDSSSFARSLGPILQRHVDFLNRCRPLVVTIINTYQYLKQILHQLDSVDGWEECRNRLLAAVDEFRQNSIYLAGAEIAERASASIRPGECVCTFGYSSVVARVLERAWLGTQKLSSSSSGHEDNHTSFLNSKSQLTQSKNIASCPFSVLVVDTRPRFEGRHMLVRLMRLGIPCEYTHIGALPTLAHKVSLAIVGAHALLNNGYVLARIGTAQVANVVSAIAHAPTLVCAETYKFWERAHSDAFEYNELGDPDDIWRGSRDTSIIDRDQGHRSNGLLSPESLPDLSGWRTNPKLRLLHLTYDVLPPQLVSAVVTEKGTLPTTSVPVVLRVKQASAVAL
ncbi:hypothetical protein EG68_02111 [Paragonimus skrjabini miyazakii]|uniref:Translation initiation factor eIF2B subunit delta n=1 Tax=Paragonimus skrjabini miyazakii TaxID=59628 RepID=A0A8S9Z5X0_9TREM|nr:hypothetical protein EG68_02111 [Paragonimus skrjabini miyazakii]